MNYGFIKEIKLSYDEALSRATDELKKEGFGVLTRIDVHEKFREKLNIDFPRYSILGACNPEMAHKAISAEQDIGLLLPCNVIVYEKADRVFVGIIKPTSAMAGIENEKLARIAKAVETKLERVFESI